MLPTIRLYPQSGSDKKFNSFQLKQLVREKVRVLKRVFSMGSVLFKKWVSANLNFLSQFWAKLSLQKLNNWQILKLLFFSLTLFTLFLCWKEKNWLKKCTGIDKKKKMAISICSQYRSFLNMGQTMYKFYFGAIFKYWLEYLSDSLIIIVWM